MKKILLPIMAVLALAACNKHEVRVETVLKTVEITITNGVADTKALTDKAGLNLNVCAASDLTALFADSEGKVKKSVVFSDATSSGSTYSFEEIPTVVTQVAVIALRGNETPGSLSAAKALWSETEMVEAEADALIVYGEDTELTYSTSKISAEVTVVPNHARIEVSAISCKDFGTYSSIALGELALTGYETYAQEIGSTLTASAPSVSAGTNKVWSWNIKEQAVKNMVLDVTVEGSNYAALMPKNTLTVNSYKVNGETIDTFKTGNVYNFAISFVAGNLDSDPASATVSADVTVTIGQWIINTTEIGFAN